MKTAVRIHLNNRVTYEELEVILKGVQVLHTFKPKYPRIPLNRLLKKTRNILRKQLRNFAHALT